MMMKLKIILCLLCCVYVQSHANMASPYRGGSKQGSPYSSRNISILHEQLSITLTSLETAEFDVIYTIEVDRVGNMFPLIFDLHTDVYAEVSTSDFMVWLDGISVPTQEVPDIYYREDSVLQKWINYFSAEHDFKAESISRMKYFEIDTLPVGVHTIRVKYTALATNVVRKIVRCFQFSYNLRPARSWREFKSLDVSIDVSDIDANCIVDLSDENKVGEYKWHFQEMPQDEILIKISPNLTWWQKTVSSLDGALFALLAILIYIIGNIYLIFRFRKKQHRKTAIGCSIIGTLLFPFLGTICYLLSLSFVDWLLGSLASGTHGYAILVFFPLICVIPFYALGAYVVDFIARKRYSTEK